jgi:hypothetical protein
MQLWSPASVPGGHRAPSQLVLRKLTRRGLVYEEVLWSSTSVMGKEGTQDWAKGEVNCDMVSATSKGMLKVREGEQILQSHTVYTSQSRNLNLVLIPKFTLTLGCTIP